MSEIRSPLVTPSLSIKLGLFSFWIYHNVFTLGGNHFVDKISLYNKVIPYSSPLEALGLKEQLIKRSREIRCPKRPRQKFVSSQLL